jgi:hypothetical protein
MKKTIYWSVESNGHIEYYFDKDKMFNDWGNAKNLIKNMEKWSLRFYSLEVEITDDMILLMLNGRFSHNLFPNYYNAKMIYANQ